MVIGVPREIKDGEQRVATSPAGIASGKFHGPIAATTPRGR
jgi:alanine dehydrogenase